MLREAVALFRRGDFVGAAEAFEELNRGGAHNPEHYLNQGNAELLAGRLPHAILSYQRGLRLDPSDRQLQTNLRYARDQVRYENGLRPADTSWPLRPATMFWGAVAFWSLMFVALTVWRMTARFTWLAATSFFLTTAILFAGGFGSWQWQAIHNDASPLIVIAQDTPLRQGNGVSYPTHTKIQEVRRGMEARQLYRRGTWLLIQLPSGDSGWVQESGTMLFSITRRSLPRQLPTS